MYDLFIQTYDLFMNSFAGGMRVILRRTNPYPLLLITLHFQICHEVSTYPSNVASLWK